MKNKIKASLCLLVALIMVVSVCKAEELFTDISLEASVSAKDMCVFVEGRFPGYESRNITALLYEIIDDVNDRADITDENSLEIIREIVQDKTDENGEFKVVVPLSSSLKSGKYKVSLGGNWTAKVYDGVEWRNLENDNLLGTFFDYVSVDEQLAFIEDVEAASKDSIISVFENVNPIIFDYDRGFGDFENAGEMFVKIRTELYQDGFDELESVGKALEQIERTYVNAHSLIVLNNSTDSQKRYDAVEKLLAVNEIFTDGLNTVSLIKKIADYTEKYTSYADFQKVSMGFAGLEMLNNATISGITKVLEDYCGYFDIDLEEYNSVNKTAVNKYLYNKDFNDIESLRKALKDGIDEYKKSGNSSNDKVSGSGGGGGGGGKATVPTEKQEISEDELSVAPENKPTAKFNDLNGYEWAALYIDKLFDKGIVNGKTETAFAPGDKVSRGEFAKMLSVAFGFENNSGVGFNDISGNEWYAEYVFALKNAGIIMGDENGNANAESNITRQDMAVMLYRVSEKCGIALDELNSRAVFSDRDEIGDYAKTAVSKLQMAGIINGNGSGGFMPKAYSSRAEASKMICCMLDLMRI